MATISVAVSQILSTSCFSGAEAETDWNKRYGIQRKNIQVSEGKNKHAKWLYYLTFIEL